MSSILVTGASGFVGSHAIPELLAGGHRVMALVRTPTAGEIVMGRLPTEERQRVELRRGDVTQPDTLRAAFDGVDGVLHLAAIPRDFSGGRDLRLINTEGTGAVIEAMEATGVRRLVHMGALGIVDDPRLHYASSKARAEQLVAGSSLDWTILKPSLQFGPRDGFFNTLADLVRVSPGLVPIPGRGNSRFQPIHAADVARVARAAFEDAATIGQKFELGGPRYWTYREIAREVITALGARRVILPMPVPLIRLVAGSAERLRLPFPVATDQLRQLGLDNIGPLGLVEAQFGFRPREMAGQLGYLRRRRRDQEPLGVEAGGMPAS